MRPRLLIHVGLLAFSALGVASTVAAQGLEEGGFLAVADKLTGYGALGLMCAWLVWRDLRRDERQEREREAHAKEREAAWVAVSRLREEQAHGNETLQRIETILRERRDRE